MDHAPFIWSSYGLATIILAWTALSPVIRKRSVLRQIEQATKRHRGRMKPAESIPGEPTLESDHDPDS